MNQAERKGVAVVTISVAIAVAISWAGSQGGRTLGPLPVFALCGLLSFGINWLVFVPAYLFQTERYFDLTGSLTYLSVVGVALVSGAPDARALILGAMVAVWAVRLGSFLFARIRQDGGDGRFDLLKPSLPRFLVTWTLQALWVLLTASSALAAMTTDRPESLGRFAGIGVAIWVLGFSVEVVADRQKRRFRADPGNDNQFIQSGLWSWSRHPNYFGEILLWCGVAVVAFPVLSGWQHLTLISPIFVYLLLTRVSGIPLLEARGRQKWGHRPEYRAYMARTARLLPRPPQST